MTISFAQCFASLPSSSSRLLAEGLSVRVLPGEPILILGRFRASLSYPLPVHRDRNPQQVKRLAVFRGEFAALPSAVREYEIQELAFFGWRLTLEPDVRAVRQFQ
jgi:hypothetical protein